MRVARAIGAVLLAAGLVVVAWAIYRGLIPATTHGLACGAPSLHRASDPLPRGCRSLVDSRSWQAVVAVVIGGFVAFAGVVFFTVAHVKDRPTRGFDYMLIEAETLEEPV